MAFLEQIGEGILNPSIVIWNSFVAMAPRVLAAVIILIAGYLIALIFGFVIKQLVKASRIDKWMLKHNKQEAIGGLTLSRVSGRLARWLVFILFLIPAANVINLEELSSVLIQFALWFPNLVLAVIIFLIGLVLANMFSEEVGKAKKVKGIKGIKGIVNIATIIVFSDIALRQIGVNVFFVESIILVMLLGLMIAIAIGFGLGLRPHAEDIIKGWRKKLK